LSAERGNGGGERERPFGRGRENNDIAVSGVESGEWRVESGEWRVESGEWRVESGERWRWREDE
jgi:hypothetical protein